MNTKTNLRLLVVFIGLFFCFNTNAENFDNKQNINSDIVDFEISFLREKDIENKKNIILNTYKAFPKSNNFGVRNGIYWFKLTINKSNYKKFIAYLPTHNINKIDIYEYSNNSLNYLSSTGNTFAQKDLALNYKFPAFKIDKNLNTTYYLKVDFPKEANFPLSIIPERNFIQYISNKQTINSFYYGTCIVIIFINLLFFIRFKDKSYLYYLLFLSCLMLIFLLYDGSFINYFRGNKLYLKLEFVIHIFAAIWFMLFSINFLDLKNKHPFYSKFFLIFPIGITILYTVYFTTNNYTFAAAGDVFGIFLLPILWMFAIYYIKKTPSAKFFVLGYLLLIPFAIYFFIGFPYGLWNVNGEMLIIKIASWLDMLVFTYALSYKMISQNKESKKRITDLQHIIKNSNKSYNSKDLEKDSNPYFSLLKENIFTSIPLTLRELDILKTICEGHSNTQISEKLFISKNTVKYHIRNIYAKIDVKNRNELKERLKSLSH